MAIKITAMLAAALAAGTLMTTAKQEAFARGSYLSHSGYGRGIGFYDGNSSYDSGYRPSRDRGNDRLPNEPESSDTEQYDPESCRYTVYWCK